MDFDAFEIDAEIEFATTDVAPSAVADHPAFELPEPELEFATSDVSAGATANHNAFELPDPEIEFAYTESVLSHAADNPGFEISLLVRSGSQGALGPNDTFGFEIDFDEYLVPIFPGNPRMTEILYPVVPVNAVSKVLTKMDSQEWRAAQKASTVPVHKRSTIRFRVDTAYLATFLGDLHTNRTAQFRLQTLGYTPFGVNSQDNFVRLLNYTSPIREQGGLTYLVDVEFYFMAVFT